MDKYWKQELIEKDERLQKIVEVEPVADGEQENFDAATFLYDLYKTSTVREIDSFK